MEQNNNKRPVEEEEQEDEQDEYEEDYVPTSKRPKTVSTIYYAIPQNVVGIREEMEFINETCECHVEISQNMPDIDSQLVEITGLPENIERAKSMIEAVVEMGKKEEEEEVEVTEKIHVPAALYGAIIGKNGAEIARLKEVSKCDIDLTLLDEHGALIQRPLTITGFPRNVEKAKAMVSEIIEKCQRDEVSETIEIPMHLCGALIGRNGENIRRMKDESNCSMTLVETAMGGAKALEISGKQSFVEHAKRMVQQFCQKFETNFRAGREIVDFVLIPPHCCSQIIGKNGVNMKKLRSWSHCEMILIQENNLPDAPKPLRISGTLQNVEKAKRLVQTQLEQILIAQSVPSSVSQLPGNSAVATKTAEIRIPRLAVGAVMGLGGANIRKLSDQTGVKIQFLADTDPTMQERGVALIGVEHKVKIAIELIREIVEQNRGGNASTLFFLEIPASKCGLVIGRGGGTIKKINAETGAHCVLGREETPSDIKTIVISGNDYQVEHAKHQLYQVLGDIPPNTPFHFNKLTTPTFAPPTETPPIYFPSAPNRFAQTPPTYPAPSQAPPTDYSNQWLQYYLSIGDFEGAETVKARIMKNLVNR